MSHRREVPFPDSVPGVVLETVRAEAEAQLATWAASHASDWDTPDAGHLRRNLTVVLCSSVTASCPATGLLEATLASLSLLPGVAPVQTDDGDSEGTRPSPWQLAGPRLIVVLDGARALEAGGHPDHDRAIGPYRTVKAAHRGGCVARGDGEASYEVYRSRVAALLGCRDDAEGVALPPIGGPGRRAGGVSPTAPKIELDDPTSGWGQARALMSPRWRCWAGGASDVEVEAMPPEAWPGGALVLELAGRHGFGWAVRCAVSERPPLPPPSPALWPLGASGPVATPALLVVQHDRPCRRPVPDFAALVAAVAAAPPGPESAPRVVNLSSPTLGPAVPLLAVSRVGHFRGWEGARDEAMGEGGRPLADVVGGRGVDGGSRVVSLRLSRLFAFFDSTHVASTRHYRNFVFGDGRGAAWQRGRAQPEGPSPPPWWMTSDPPPAAPGPRRAVEDAITFHIRSAPTSRAYSRRSLFRISSAPKEPSARTTWPRPTVPDARDLTQSISRPPSAVAAAPSSKIGWGSGSSAI